MKRETCRVNIYERKRDAPVWRTRQTRSFVLSCLVLSCLLLCRNYNRVLLSCFLCVFLCCLIDPSPVTHLQYDWSDAISDHVSTHPGQILGNRSCFVLFLDKKQRSSRHFVSEFFPKVSCVLFLSCLILSCLVLSCLVLSCLVLSCLVLSCHVLSCLVLSCPVLSCLVLSCLVLSCLGVSWRVVSCRVLSCLVLPCLVLSCLAVLSFYYMFQLTDLTFFFHFFQHTFRIRQLESTEVSSSRWISCPISRLLYCLASCIVLS